MKYNQSKLFSPSKPPQQAIVFIYDSLFQSICCPTEPFIQKILGNSHKSSQNILRSRGVNMQRKLERGFISLFHASAVLEC